MTGPRIALLLRPDLSHERLFYVDTDELVDLMADHLGADEDNPMGSALGLGLDIDLVLWLPLLDDPDPAALQPNISASFLYWGHHEHEIVPMFGAALITGAPNGGQVTGLDAARLAALEDFITWGPAKYLGDTPESFFDGLREIAAREPLLQDRGLADRALFGNRLN